MFKESFLQNINPVNMLDSYLVKNMLLTEDLDKARSNFISLVVTLSAVAYTGLLLLKRF